MVDSHAPIHLDMLEGHHIASGLDMQEIGDEGRCGNETGGTEPDGRLLVPIEDEMGNDGHLSAPGGRLSRTDVGALAGLAVEEAVKDKLVDRLTDCLARDPEGLGYLAFRGQLLPGAGQAGVDLLEDGLFELQVERLRFGLIERKRDHAMP